MNARAAGDLKLSAARPGLLVIFKMIIVPSVRVRLMLVIHACVGWKEGLNNGGFARSEDRRVLIDVRSHD